MAGRDRLVPLCDVLEKERDCVEHGEVRCMTWVVVERCPSRRSLRLGRAVDIRHGSQFASPNAIV